MSLPILSQSGKYDPVRAIGQKKERTVGQWGGLDERLIIDENCFSAMRNMSSRFFPAIATREPRGADPVTYKTMYGIYWKNGLFSVFEVDYPTDYAVVQYNNVYPEMNLTKGPKQIVGMGAYICVFPDKKIYNTVTGEITSIDTTYTQTGTITFAELTPDSAFCKITGTGLDTAFKAHDGVRFEGVNDKAFLVDGEPATKTISEIGTGYIVVPAVIQNSYIGKVSMWASGTGTKIQGTGIPENFGVNDIIKVVGAKDDALNVENKFVTAVGADYIVIDSPFQSKAYTQSQTVTFSAYYEGSDLTRIYANDMGSMFAEGDKVTIAGCTNSNYNGSFIVKAAGTNYILVDGTLAADFTQSSGLTITRTSFEQAGVTVKRTSFIRASGITVKRTSPDFDFVCEHENRLWACNSDNHEVYASKLGDPTNWNCYEGISTDSYTVTIGSDGDFTGCCSYMGQVLFFKEQTIHILYGNKPSNYQLSELHMPGVRAGSAASLCVVDQVLYYIGRNGVYRFGGASPEKISDQITSELTEGVSGHQDGKLYLSCLKDGARALLVYDPKYQAWYHEDSTQFKFAVFGEGKLYYVDGENKLRTITGTSTDVIEWSIESGDLRESLLDQKYISKARFSLWMDAEAEADIYFRFDEDPMWHRAGTVHSVTPKAYNIPIVPQRCNKFRWKMEGKGQIKLLAMGITVEGGSEINGNIHSWFRK